MITLPFPRPTGRPLRILCLGAHSDDIEVGAGGFILRLIEEVPDAAVRWVVLGAAGVRVAEAEAAARHFLAGAVDPRVTIRGFRDGFFPHEGVAIKEFFEQLKGEDPPDLILTHQRHDLHQDHRVVCELTWNTFRDHLILEYEIVKYDGDLGAPNAFCHLSESQARRKVKGLMAGFASQQAKPWYSSETFYAMLRIRGVESRAPEGYAEGFYCRKVVF